MELLFLIAYSFFAWLIFFKFKWLPWNITTQVITITIPLFLIAIVILLLNIGAPSSTDVRVLNYVVQVVPRVTGRVIEVPVEPNRPVKKGEVLFKIDPVPFELEVKAAEANLVQMRAKLLTARANQSAYEEQMKGATGKKEATAARLDLARKRAAQYKELAATGAGNRFDFEQAETDVQNLSDELTALAASESQAKAKLAAKTKEGEQDEVAQARAQIAQAEAQLGDAKWKVEQTVFYAPADGTVINMQLRVGSVASQLVMNPVMTFVENEQWLIATYMQNEVREVKPGDEAEVAMKMYPGRIIKCKVDSVVWATAQGQLPISGNLPNLPPMPPERLAVKLMLDGKDRDLFLAAGARGQGAIYTDYGEIFHIIRKVFLRVSAKLDWLILKLH